MNRDLKEEKSTGFSESLWPIVRKEFLDTLIKQKRKKLRNWNLFKKKKETLFYERHCLENEHNRS